MRSKRTKSKIKIPRLAIPIIIAIFIILSVSGFKSILNYSPEKRPMNQKITLAPNSGEFGYSKMRSSNPLLPPLFKREEGGIHQEKPFSDYQAIVENNIFRPLGWEKAKPAPILPVVRRRREIPRERPAPTYTLTLTGIVKKGGEQIALIEDSREKEGYFLHRGEQLKDCKVNAIEGEQIILARADAELKLALGEEIRYNTSGQILLSSSTSASRPALERNEGLAVRPKQSTSIVEDAQKGESLSVSEDERLSIIERLKLRRKEQLNQ